MQGENVDNTNAQFDSGVTDSAAVEENQNVETQTGNVEAQSSAETKNTERAEHMIPKSRFDEVNNQYKSLKEKSEAYKAYEQFDNLLRDNPDLAEEVKSVLEKRKLKREEQTQKKPSYETQQQNDPVSSKLSSLEQKLAYIEAEKNVNQYQRDFENLFSQSGLPESAKEVFRKQVEANVLSNLGGRLDAPYNEKVVSSVFNSVKQDLEPILKGTAETYQTTKQNQRVPVSKPNAPIETKKLASAKDRIAFIANGMKAGN